MYAAVHDEQVELEVDKWLQTESSVSKSLRQVGLGHNNERVGGILVR